ncbi:MAG: prohibitin family protein [Myxococcota bacterium]|nr:prohibitin family protein [Myxococcota bacterium]
MKTKYPQKHLLLLYVLTLSLLSGCAVIRPGEVGVKQQLGKLDSKVHQSGSVLINPFTTQLVKVPIQTKNIEVNLSLPSKEGLNVNSVISILYSIEEEKVRELIENVGLDYENVLILSVFRSAAADVCAQFYAKDMHSGNRSSIESKIKMSMEKVLSVHGFNIEAVLMKSINLPKGLYRAIEKKLEAEQEAQRMQFVLQKERQEAERKKIEAIGIRDAHLILTEGMNPSVVQWRSLEVLSELASSPNSKLILTDGKTPVLINTEEE